MCLDCRAWEDQYAAILQDYEIADRERRRALREVARLNRELNGSRSKESVEIREFLDEWDRVRRKLFPHRRDVKLDMDGERAAVVRAAKRRGWSQEELLKVPKGAALDAKISQNPSYFEVSNLLSKDRWPEEHVQRYDDFVRLREAGFAQPVKLIRVGVSARARKGSPEWWAEQLREEIAYAAWLETRERGAGVRHVSRQAAA